MKTEDQLLLTYMYQEDYSEEDMYDDRVIQQVRHSRGFFFFEVKATFERIAAQIFSAFSCVGKIVQKVWKEASETFEPREEYSITQELIKYSNFSIPRTDFRKRSIMRYQVLNRKPNHLVRKIIH